MGPFVHSGTNQTIKTLLLSEFGDFKENLEDSLIQTFNQYIHLLSKMIKHGIGREVIEWKVTFMNGLRPEWMSVILTVKAQEQFKDYSLAKLVWILKSHEIVVTKYSEVVSNEASLALVAIGKFMVDEESKTDLLECDLTSEEYALMVSNPKSSLGRNSLLLRTETGKRVIVPRRRRRRTKMLLRRRKRR